MSHKRLAPDQLKALTLAELDRWEFQLVNSDLAITDRIEAAEARGLTSEWLTRAHSARRAMRVDLDRVRRRRNEVRRQQWARQITADDPFLAAFHEAAQETLTDSLYGKVIEKTRAYLQALEHERLHGASAMMGDVKPRAFAASRQPDHPNVLKTLSERPV